MEDMDRWIAQLRKGLVELSVMGALDQGEAYGYQILQRLAALDALAVSESTVYPILARLAKGGLVSVRTADSPAGPQRRYYRLNSAGRSRLKTMRAYWRELRSEVDQLVLAGGGKENAPRIRAAR